MNIKAIGFDIGQTIIQYNKPLNWKSLYRPALEQVLFKCNIPITEDKILKGMDVLSKYNTRINYREYEVSSDIIFTDILDSWDVDMNAIDNAKSAFYLFFQQEAHPFEDVIELLTQLKLKGIKIGILTDVAYGMDNIYSLNDIKSISEYIDVALTSVDVGYRKPNEKGFKLLLERLNVNPEEMIFVGDEEKDVSGANNVGICSVLINRDNILKDYSQHYTIDNLLELLNIS
jgi:putative hydrolase of the HAD superfamily